MKTINEYLSKKPKPLNTKATAKLDTNQTRGAIGMREIKFRAYSTVNGKMWPVRSILGPREYTPEGSVQLARENNLGDDGLIDTRLVHLTQYTGLKDKNGIEIYEGDIVEYKAYNIWHRDEVKFTDGKFHGNLNGVKEELQSRYDLGLIVTLGCEVIGNIYENKELLAESEQE